jgi:hypothetical protein
MEYDLKHKSYVLLLLALQVKPDLVLMGKQAIDGDNCQTGEFGHRMLRLLNSNEAFQATCQRPTLACLSIVPSQHPTQFCYADQNNNQLSVCSLKSVN